MFQEDEDSEDEQEKKEEAADDDSYEMPVKKDMPTPALNLGGAGSS